MSLTQKKVLNIEDRKVIKVLEKPFTRQILNIFDKNPLTASEIAEAISFPKDKIHYHIKKLLSLELLYITDAEIIKGIEQKKFLPTAKHFIIKEKEYDVNKPTSIKRNIIEAKTKKKDNLNSDGDKKLSSQKEIIKNKRLIIQRRVIPDRRYFTKDNFKNIERRFKIRRYGIERRIRQGIQKEDIKLSINGVIPDDNAETNKLLNYNLQLNGVKDALSFVHTGSHVVFSLIKLEFSGFVVKKTKRYSFPIKINGIQITTLPELIINVYSQYFSDKYKRKVYIAIHSDSYSYKMTFLESNKKSRANLKKSIINIFKNSKVFKPQQNIFDYVSDQKSSTVVCYSDNKEQIAYDYKILKEIGLNPRYNTSIPKILLNIHNYYNLGLIGAISVVVYIDHRKTYMVSIFEKSLVSSVDISIGLKSFTEVLIARKTVNKIVNETNESNAIHYLEKFGILLKDVNDTIKVNHLSENKNNSINDISNKIIFEIQSFIKAIKLYNHSNNYKNQNISSIYIGGVGSHIKNIDKKFSDGLDFKVERLDKVNFKSIKKYYDSKRNIWVQAREKSLLKKQRKHSRSLEDVQKKILNHSKVVDTAKSPERAKYRITRLEIDQNTKVNSINRLTKKLIKSASDFKLLKDEYMKTQDLIQTDTDTITKQLDSKREGLLIKYKEYDYLTKRMSEIDFENDNKNTNNHDEKDSSKLEYAGQIKKASAQRNKLNEEKEQYEKECDDLQLQILGNQEKVQKLELKIDSGYDDAAISEYLINTIQNTAKAFERSLLVHLKTIDRLKKEDLNALKRVGYLLVQNNEKLKEIKNNYENQKIEELEILIDKPGEKEYAVEVRNKLIPIIDLIIETTNNLDQLKSYTANLIHINIEQSELQKKQDDIKNKLKKKNLNKIEEEQKLTLLKTELESTLPILEDKKQKRLELLNVITQLRRQILKTKDIINNIDLKIKENNANNEKKLKIGNELKTIEVDLSEIKATILKNGENLETIQNNFLKNNQVYEERVTEFKPQIENVEDKINSIREEISENSIHQTGLSNEIKSLLERNNQIEKFKIQKSNELKELNIKKIPVIQKLDEAKRNLKIELNIDQKNLKKERDLSIKRASNTKKVTIKTFFKKELASLEKKRIAVQALLLKSTKDIEKSFQSKKKSEEMLDEKIKNKSPLISKLEKEIKTWENSLAKSKAIQDKLNNLEVQRSDWEEYLEKERLIRDSKVNDLVKNIKRKEKKSYLLFLTESLKRSNNDTDAITVARSIVKENISSDKKQIKDFENIFIDIIKRHKLFMTNYKKSHKKIVQELKPYGGQEKSIKRKIKNANTKIKDAQRVIDSFQKKLNIRNKALEEKEVEFIRFNKEAQKKLDDIQNEINQIPKKQERARDEVSNKLINKLEQIKENKAQLKEKYKINLIELDADLQNHDLIIKINKINNRLKNESEELLLNNINQKKLTINLQKIKETISRLIEEEKSYSDHYSDLKRKLDESKAIFELKDKTLHKELKDEENELIINQENEDRYNQKQRKLKLEKINVDNDIKGILKDINKLKLKVKSPLKKVEKLVGNVGEEINDQVNESEKFNDLVQMEKDFTVNINLYDKDIKDLYKTLDTIQGQESSIIKKVNILVEDIKILKNDFLKLDKIVDSNKSNRDQIGINHLKTIEKLEEIQDIYFPTKTMLNDRIDSIYNLVEKNKNQKNILKEKVFELEKRLKTKRVESAKVDNELSQINRNMKKVLELSIDDNEAIKREEAQDTVKEKIQSYVDLVEMKSRTKQLFNEITETEKDISILKEKKASLNRSFTENENINKKKIIRLEENCGVLEKKIMIDKEELSILEKKLNELNRNASSYGSRVDILEKELEDFKTKAEEHEDTLKDLDRSLEKIKEKASKDKLTNNKIIENTIELDYMANLGLLMDSKNELNLIPEDDKNDFKYFKSNNILRNSFLALTTVFAFAAYSQKVKIDPLENLLPKKSSELTLLNMRQEMKKEIYEKSRDVNGLDLLIKEDKNLSFNMVTLLKYLTQVTPKRFKVTELKLGNKPSRFIRNEVNKINLENSNILVSIKGFYGLTLEDSKVISDSFILFLKESGKFKSVEISSAQKISKWRTNYEIELVL